MIMGGFLLLVFGWAAVALGSPIMAYTLFASGFVMIVIGVAKK